MSELNAIMPTVIRLIVLIKPIMLSVVMLNVFNLSVVMLSAVMLNVFTLSVQRIVAIKHATPSSAFAERHYTVS